MSGGLTQADSGRRFIGIEKDPAIFDIATRRLSGAVPSTERGSGK